MLFCQILFSASIEMIIGGFSFILLMWCVTWFNFCIRNYLCLWRLSPSWPWCMIFLICCWIQLASNFSRTFSLVFIRKIDLFSCILFIWFWYQGNSGLLEWVSMCFIIFNFFLKTLRKIGIKFFFKWWVELTLKPSGTELSLLGSFWLLS